MKQFFRKAFNNFRGEGQKWIVYKKKKCVQAGLRIANFIDVQFNLIRGTYQPHSKPDNTPVYINKKSNHPPLVLKQLPNVCLTFHLTFSAIQYQLAQKRLTKLVLMMPWFTLRKQLTVTPQNRKRKVKFGLIQEFH